MKREIIVINSLKEKIKVSVETADTPLDLSKGLMRRKFLSSNEGMLLIFPKESLNPIWMKDTSLPLDLIFIGSVGEIVDIKGGAPNSLSKIYPARLCKYVLEVNAGFCHENKIKIGNEVIL